MNNLDKQYQDLLNDILHKGVSKDDRTGTGTYSVFGRQIRHNMKDGFPLLTTKKMAWKTLITELLWFLKGDTHIKFLLDHNCHIWDGDAYAAYRKSVETHYEKGGDVADKKQFIEEVKRGQDKDWGELGPVYGKQWRGWFNYDSNVEPVYVDQIQKLIDGIKENPDSRRHMVNAWNVGELDKMVLPPCHYGFQCYVRDGKYLSLMWNQRSVDTFLGLPFNIASYGLLLMMIAKECDLIPDELIGNFGDVHLYKNHVEQAIEQTKREPYTLPDVAIKSNINFKAAMKRDLDKIIWEDFVLLGYQYHPTIKAKLSN
ncbi:MAG: thymidylate synthase [Flavobacteriaceae bacterium]|nr:thymidylate synthase [Flavobacteriaceae bacterium]|tara:strand:- start:791 stop:1732 length:942 start_codon:yes stop_codon:yes gene_type:complete